jgi:hypothetical protein
MFAMVQLAFAAKIMAGEITRAGLVGKFGLVGGAKCDRGRTEDIGCLHERDNERSSRSHRSRRRDRDLRSFRGVGS